jgi:hypothetical protein
MNSPPHIGLATQLSAGGKFGMSKKKGYVVESDFDDLHGEPDDAPDLELDLSDSENPIIKAALSNEDWSPPEKDEKDEDEDEDEEDDLDESEDEDEDDDLEDLDEEDEESEESEDEDDDDDDEKYSKKVQKRIDRERDLRVSESVKSDKRIAKLEKSLELRDAKDKFNSKQGAAESKLRKLRKQKTEALDEGETEKVVDIDEQILDIKAEGKADELELKRLEKDLESSDDDVQDGLPEEGRKWIDKYPQFNTNKQFNKVALQADKMVAARNFDKNTSEYYEEMEKILAPQFPEIVKLAKKTTKANKRKATAKKKRRSAVGSTTKAGTRRGKTRRGVVRLTKADQDQMEIFGMDPQDPVQAKAFAAEKRG